MGWRVGQGIGPRLTYRQKKLQDIELSFGDNIKSDAPEDDEEASKHTYARRDTRILVVERKDNFHGLGYNPGMGLNESLGVKDDKRTSKGPQISSMAISIIITFIRGFIQPFSQLGSV
jgi:G patch domain-containing protein 1